MGSPRRKHAPEFYFSRHYMVKENGCWLWQGRLYPNGYGQFHECRKVVYAHRFAYVQKHGAIPVGMEIDHLCRNRACVNPDHLEAVTRLVNVRRSSAVKSACPKGHPYDEANTYIDAHGWKRCRTCGREQKRAKVSTEEIRRVAD